MPAKMGPDEPGRPEALGGPPRRGIDDPGGFVIVDDYGEDAWTDCRAAVEDYRTANAITAPVTWVDRRCAWWRKG